MAKSLPHNITHKKPETQNPRIFFHCSLEDLSNLLRVWTAL